MKLPDEFLLVREITKESFYRFVQEFWSVIIPEKPIWNWHIKYLCDEVQLMLERVFAGQPKLYDLIINVPPSTSKCEVAGNFVLTQNGYVPVEDLRLEDSVVSYSFDSERLINQRIIRTESYYDDCVKIHTRLGFPLCVSGTHPIYTDSGWKKASDLTSDDFVFQLCTKYPFTERVPDAELDFITLMLFDGGTSGGSKIYTKKEPRMRSLFHDACSNLGLVSKDRQNGITIDIRDSEHNRSGGAYKTGKTKLLLQKYGIDRTLSKHKRLPSQFFTMSIDQKYRFLGLMIASDGFIDKYGCLHIVLASEGLIEDIKRLLSLCGIISTIKYAKSRYKKPDGTFWEGDSWRLDIHSTYLADLLKHIDCLHKQIRLRDKTGTRTHMRFYPYSIIANVRNGKIHESVHGTTYITPDSKTRIRLTHKVGNSIKHYAFNRLCAYEPHLKDCVPSDFVFDPVESVESVGKKQIYHIQVESDHYDNSNYISNNILVHNSTLFSIFLTNWVWTRMLHARIVACSYSGGLAFDFSRKSRDVFHSEKYQKCFPEVKLKLEQAMHFTNTGHGERYCAGIGGAITGKHANVIIIDDPMNPMEAASEAGIRTANMWLHETITTRTVDAKLTPTIMIMQRLHQDDPTGDWLANAKEGSYKHICLPADCSEGQLVLPEEIKENYVDGLFDPVRLPKDLLEQRRKWMGEYGYACQYDQHPIPRSGGMFLVDRLRIGHVDPSDPIVFMIRYWDKAVSLKKTACYTVGAKIGKTRMGKYYVLDIIRGRWDSNAREQLIRTTAEQDGKKVIVGIEQEPGPIWEMENVLMGDGSYKLLKDIEVGDFVINKNGVPTKVAGVHIQGNLPCLAIKTDSGRVVHAAKSHPFLTPNGFVEAGNLLVGNILALLSNIKTNTTTFPLIDFDRLYHPDPILSIDNCETLPCRCLTVADGESFVVNGIVVHNSGGFESAINTVRNLDGFTCKIDKADIHKETRAEPFSSQVNGYNVTLVPGAWNTEYISELQYFPNSKYKDQVDASSGAFNLIATLTRRVARGWS